MEVLVPDFFADAPERIPFGGLESTDPLSFKIYQPERTVMGKRMDEHLRPGVREKHECGEDAYITERSSVCPSGRRRESGWPGRV